MTREHPLAVLAAGMLFLLLVFGSVLAFGQEPEARPDFSIHDSDIAVAEAAWQGLNLLDIATSVKGAASDYCYVENDPIARHIVGPHPSAAGAIGWGVSNAVVHYVVSAELSEHDAPAWVQWAWQAVNFVGSGRAVVTNFRIGVRFGGPNYHPGYVGTKTSCRRVP